MKLLTAIGLVALCLTSVRADGDHHHHHGDHGHHGSHGSHGDHDQHGHDAHKDHHGDHAHPHPAVKEQHHQHQHQHHHDPKSIPDPPPVPTAFRTPSTLAQTFKKPPVPFRPSSHNTFSTFRKPFAPSAKSRPSFLLNSHQIRELNRLPRLVQAPKGPGGPGSKPQVSKVPQLPQPQGRVKVKVQPKSQSTISTVPSVSSVLGVGSPGFVRPPRQSDFSIRPSHLVQVPSSFRPPKVTRFPPLLNSFRSFGNFKLPGFRRPSPGSGFSAPPPPPGPRPSPGFPSGSLGSQQLRRNQNVPAIYYTKAEDIQGYQKFTLDDVIYPDKAEGRSDSADDLVLVDAADEVAKVEAIEPLEDLEEQEEGVAKSPKSPTDFELRR